MKYGLFVAPKLNIENLRVGGERMEPHERGP